MREFEEIYTTYFSDVFRYIRKLSGNDHIAEEVTAETFFKAMRSIHSFRGDCDIRVWLCQIAKNSYLSYLKKHARLTNLESTDVLPTISTTWSMEEQLILHDEATQIKEALHSLPDPYKEVFMWRVYAQLSFRQIGQLFGKTENWACVTYHRARMKIKEGLEVLDHEK